jgi:hypothetical protein
MPKTNKKAQKIILSRRTVASTTVICAVILGVAVVAWLYTAREREAANVAQLRSMLLHSLESSIKPAPVDAKTGDTYFPALKVYMPADSLGSTYDFTYDTNAYGDSELSASPTVTVSRRTVIDEAETGMLNARDATALFETVDEAQKSTRCVTMASQPLKNTEGLKFHSTQKLADGRELSFYYEPGCKGVAGIVEDLRNLRPY